MKKISPRVKSRLEKIVASRNNWASCKALTRPDEAKFDILKSGDLFEIDTPVRIPQICQVKPRGFYITKPAYLNGRTQKNMNCRGSSKKCVELNRFEGGISIFEE